MRFRPATDRDLKPVRAALESYAESYSQRVSDGRPPTEFIDGRPSNIEDAGWLHYEGTDAWFQDGILGQVLPWLVMNVLVECQDCEWIVDEATMEIAVTHRDLNRPITANSLNDGSWLEEPDYDAGPSEGGVALDSYGDIQRLLAKKRIFGSTRLPT